MQIEYEDASDLSPFFVCRRNLIRLDVLSESDPLVRVEQFDPTTGRWSEVGRTEWQQYALLRAPPLSSSTSSTSRSSVAPLLTNHLLRFRNQKNPNFARCIPMDYWFEKARALLQRREA
jgi:hypothetical protein